MTPTELRVNFALESITSVIFNSIFFSESSSGENAIVLVLILIIIKNVVCTTYQRL